MEHHPKPAVHREPCRSLSEVTSEGTFEAVERRARPRGPERSVLQRQTNFRLLTVDEVEQLPDPEWLIEGMLPTGAFAMLYGEPGAGKSFLALDWANCTASANDWLGRGVKATDAVYVYAEGTAGLKLRTEAWCKAHGGKPEHIRFLPWPINMLDSEEVELLIKLIGAAELEPGLIVIDTLARCFGEGDENAAQHMNAFVAGADGLRAAFPGSTVLVVHHSGKDPTKRDRGHSALRAAADTVLRLSKLKHGLSLSCEKQKDAEQFQTEALTLSRVDLDEERTSCVIEAIQKPTHCSLDQGTKSADPRARKNDQKVLDALAGFGPDGASHSEWRTASGLAKSTFNDRLSRLIESEEVIQEGRTYRLAQSGPKAESGPEQGRQVTA